MLVADDDAADRLLLFRLLEHDGHHPTVADDGRAALELLRREPFDLVLLDLVMPGLDGVGVLQAMKRDVRLRTTPVIMVSGADKLDDVVRCLKLGADDYVDKPIDPVVLRARVDASLTKKRLQAREDEYLDAVGHLAEAASSAGRGAFDPQTLEPVTRRIDSLGQLARVVTEMAAHVSDLPAGEPRDESTDPP